MAAFTDLITFIGAKLKRILFLESEAENDINGHKRGRRAIAKLANKSYTKANERFLSILKSNQAEIIILEKKMQDLVAEFDREFAKELIFNEQDLRCSNTGNPESKQIEMNKKFNRVNSEIIEGIRTKEKNVVAQINELIEANRILQLRIDSNNHFLTINKAELSE